MAAHHLVSRYSIKNSVHDGPLWSCNAPSAFGFFLGKCNCLRTPDIHFQLSMLDKNATPDNFARLAHAFQRSASETKIHGRLPFAHRSRITTDIVGWRHGP